MLTVFYFFEIMNILMITCRNISNFFAEIMQKKFIFTAAVFLVLFFAAIKIYNPLQAKGAESEIEITGKVLDIFTDARIYKASVSFGENSFETGASGHYKALVERGAYNLSVSHGDYYQRQINSYAADGDETFDFYLIPKSFDLQTFQKFGGYSFDRCKFKKPPVFIINTGKFKNSKNTFDSKQIDSINSVINELKSFSDFFKLSAVEKRSISSENDVPPESISINRDDLADYTEGGHAQFLPVKHSSVVVMNPLYNNLEGFFEVALRHELMHAIGFYTHVPPDIDSILVPTLPIPPNYTDLDKKVIKLFYRMPFSASYPHTTSGK